MQRGIEIYLFMYLSTFLVPIVHCTCNEGYGGPSCTVCEVGKYSDTVGTESCKSCWTEPDTWPDWTLMDGWGEGGVPSFRSRVCPMRSTSSRTTSVYDCVCPQGCAKAYIGDPGMGNDASEICLQCGPGEYATLQNNIARNLQGLYQDYSCLECGQVNAVSIEDYGSTTCVCDVGYFAVNDNDGLTCESCPSDTTTSVRGADNVLDCQCNAGYTGQNGGPCTFCEEGKHKDSLGSTSCIGCAYGQEPDTTHTFCKLCEIGKYRNNYRLSCTECAFRHYAENEGSLECTICPAYSFTLSEGSTSLSDCQTCDSGYEWIHEVGCSICTAGKYESGDTCLDCPANTWSEAGGMVPETPGYQITDHPCQCNAGYYYATSCQKCPAGYYKPDVASVGITSCLVCTAGTFSLEASGTCTACASGFYSTAQSSSCLQCSTNSVSEAGSAECLCMAGYFSPTPDAGSDLVCYECEAGKYKSNIGSTMEMTYEQQIPCFLCEAGTYSLKASSSCSLCPIGTYASGSRATVCTDCDAGKTTLSMGGDDMSACTSCNAGYGFVEGSGCQQCTAGTYSTNVYNGCSTDSVQCLSFSIIPCCHHQMYICLQCLAGENSLPGSSTCTCDVGYSWTLMANGAYGCIACEVGKFKGTIGTVACETCVSGTFSSLAATTCQTCAASFPNNIAHSWYTSSGSSTQDDCVAICGLGFGNDNNGQECLECPPNTFSATIDMNPCESCAENQISTAGAHECVCPTGQLGIDLGCRCNSGHYVLKQSSGITCQSCGADTFIAEDAHEKEACDLCSELASTNGLSGQNSCDYCANNLMKDPFDNICKCPPGYTIDTNIPNSCSLCPDNYMKNTYGASLCTQCNSPFLANVLRTECVCVDDYELIDGLCVACPVNAISRNGASCTCQFGYVIQEVLSENLDATQNISKQCIEDELSNCVVNRRVPKFAIQYNFKSRPVASTQYASREEGGVCHMQRLFMVNNTAAEYQDPEIDYSYQMCTRNSTALQCIMLGQNNLDVTKSKQEMFSFDLKSQEYMTENLLSKHRRSKLCSTCDQHSLTDMMSRFNKLITTTGKSQLSFGLPYRLSTERLLIASLHKEFCGSNNSCPALTDLMCGANENNCLQQGQSMTKLFDTVRESNIEQIERSEQNLVQASTDLLWDRNWVFCKYIRNVNQVQSCQGSIPRHVWLNVSTRYNACLNVFKDIPQDNGNVIHFCLLNKDTARLCQEMIEWKEQVRQILCQAAGLCPSTAFFYSPTQFNLQEKEFVHDTVTRFYQESADKKCASDSSQANIRIQKKSNQDKLENCASVHIQPFVTITQQVRKIKRTITLIFYHYYRIIWHLLHVMSVGLIELGASWARQNSNSLEIAISKLMREVIAFVQSIGSLIDNIGQTVLKLVTSKGIGKHLKELFRYICLSVEFIFNKIWSPVICPVIQFVIDIAQDFQDVMKVIQKILFSSPALMYFIPVIDSINAGIEEALQQLENSLNECQEKEFGCDFEEDPTTRDENLGELPVPTRCWSTYLTFFGDNQQLSCTRADTCKTSRTSGSDTTVCAACPEQENPNIQDFACDYVTKLCTCSVPRLETTYCSSNDDCMHREFESSCRLLSDDLQISRSSLPCTNCQYERLCYIDYADANSQLGVCVCGATQRHFQTCSRQDYESQETMSLILNNLCLYTQSRQVISFRESTVTQCLYLDPTTSSCAYVNEKNYFLVRGHRTVGRRLLQVEHADSDSTTQQLSYVTHNPLCQDALKSKELAYTRGHCLKLYALSKDTVAALGMQNQLPPCVFCSFEDVLEAVHNNPFAFLHIMTSISHVSKICSKHGPLQYAFGFVTKLLTALKFTSQLIAADMNTNNTFITSYIDKNGMIRINADEKILPKHIATSIEHFLQSLSLLIPNTYFQSTVNTTLNTTNQTNENSRHLLFFREMIDAISTNYGSFTESIQESEVLHQSFVSSISHVVNYQYLENKEDQFASNDMPTWPPYQTKTDGSSCAELEELLSITTRVANGTLQGWRTILGNRDNIQRQPVSTLSAAWPPLTEAPAVFRPSDNVLSLNASEISDDFVTYWSLTGLRIGLEFVGFEVRTLFDFFYSLLIESKNSFTCPYEAVQTCSEWHVRIWQGLIIVTIWFTVWALIANAIGLSVLVSLSIPLHALLVLRICYGYTWTCLPMIPICAWQDLIETMDMIFPLSMELPAEMKKLDPTCLQHLNVAEETCNEMAAENSNVFPTNQNSQFMCLQVPRYPANDCLLTCKDPPFAFTSAMQVLTWILAELAVHVNDWFQTFTIEKAHLIPFFDADLFEAELNSKVIILSRDAGSMIRAQRICAIFSGYFLIPYLLIIVFVLAYLSIFAQMLVTQLYPFILSITSLFAAILMSSSSQADDILDIQNDNELQDDSDVLSVSSSESDSSGYSSANE